MASRMLSPKIHPSRLFVTISGNLATGKTSLCKELEKRFKESKELKRLESSKILYEEYQANPHLPKFYEHLKEKVFVYNPHSYKTQLSFMEHRFDQLSSALKDNRDSPIVEDRSLFEFAEVFASCQAARGLMTSEEFDLYNLHLAPKNLILPDLLIFLKGNKKEVQIRNREIEKDLAEEYLHQLDLFLNKFVERMSSRGTEVFQPPHNWLENGFLTEEGTKKIFELISKRSSNKVEKTRIEDVVVGLSPFMDACLF